MTPNGTTSKFMETKMATPAGDSIYGVRIKNPLPKPVRIEIVVGKTIVRQSLIGAGQTVFMPLDNPGPYDIRTTILETDPSSHNMLELGECGFKVIDHQDVETPRVEPLAIVKTITLNSQHWKTVIFYHIQPRSSFSLKAVEITPHPWIKWRLKIDDKFTDVSQSMSFSDCILTGGQSIALQAQNIAGCTEQTRARLSGELTTMSILAGIKTGTPARVDIDDEHGEVRTLGDLFKDMSKKEVPA
jgi:hypothetical protein